jgi:NADH-quinone oxidoreductase subunit E
MPFALTPERQREMADILSRYPTLKAAVIPLLLLCQEQQGWVSEDVMVFVADKLGVTLAQIRGVTTFYSRFREKPAGKHEISVCRTLSCALRGADQILHQCEERLGIHAGETTPDGKVTLRTAECLASCGTGPMMQVDRRYYENLTASEVSRILDQILGA